MHHADHALLARVALGKECRFARKPLLKPRRRDQSIRAVLAGKTCRGAVYRMKQTDTIREQVKQCICDLVESSCQSSPSPVVSPLSYRRSTQRRKKKSHVDRAPQPPS